jgi:23S rRNA (pseudouridine1915-N3)-methyltransferase
VQVSIIAVGKIKDGPERELIARYQQRFTATGKSLGLSGPTILELKESRAPTSAQRCRDEAKRMLDTIPDGAFVIALDERGKNLSSEAFARKIQQVQEDGGRSLAILIGGADGHGHEVRQRANLLLSFGQLTWPHQLVRLLLVEQLYRATTILSGHPYHRA